jgi:hypothetical protein
LGWYFPVGETLKGRGHEGLFAFSGVAGVSAGSANVKSRPVGFAVTEESMREFFWGRQKNQQIPFGDDNKKSRSKSNDNDNSRSPSGMTTRRGKCKRQ